MHALDMEQKNNVITILWVQELEELLQQLVLKFRM
jgi:hypothetical protein